MSLRLLDLPLEGIAKRQSDDFLIRVENNVCNGFRPGHHDEGIVRLIRKLDKPRIGRHRYGFDLRLCSHIETDQSKGQHEGRQQGHFVFHDMSSLIAKWVTNNPIGFFMISASVSGASIA